MEEDSAESIFLKQIQFDPENDQEIYNAEPVEETAEPVHEDFSIFHRITASQSNYESIIKPCEKEAQGNLVQASAITFDNAPNMQDVNGIDTETEKLSNRSPKQKSKSGTSTRRRSKSRRRPKSRTRSISRKKGAARSRSKSKKRTG